MAKCPYCGREIGSTAGPCVQCTCIAKKSKNGFFEKFISKLCSKKEKDLISCPFCNSTKVLVTSTVLYFCEDCKRVF